MARVAARARSPRLRWYDPAEAARRVVDEEMQQDDLTRPMHRKLAAILGADVVAYSKHMAADEERTLAALHEVMGAFELFARQHGGRPFGRAGDSDPGRVREPGRGGALRRRAAAPSGAAARHADGGRAAGAADGREPRRRDRGRGNVYGDGVNTAARLQGLAGAGGLVVSRSAYEHLRGKIDLRFEHMGAHKLHNLAARVHAYRADIGTGSKPRLAPFPPGLSSPPPRCCSSRPWPAASSWPIRGRRPPGSARCRNSPRRCRQRRRSRSCRSPISRTIRNTSIWPTGSPTT